MRAGTGTPKGEGNDVCAPSFVLATWEDGMRWEQVNPGKCFPLSLCNICSHFCWSLSYKELVLVQAACENEHAVPASARALPNASSTTKSSDLLISSIPGYWKGKKHLKPICSEVPIM